MILRNLQCLPTSLLALITTATATVAQLPYNPTRLLVSQNGSSAYIFSQQPSSSQFELVLLNTSDTVHASTPSLSTIYASLPFLSTSTPKAFIPLIDDEGDITVLSGDCGNGAAGSELWRLTMGGGKNNDTWSRLSVSSSDPSLGANFLSAGLSFSPTRSSTDASLYVFGGMCPNSTSSRSTGSDWTIDATYSDSTLLVSPASSSALSISSIHYDLSIAGTRGPPVAEAGLTITPLLPITSNTSTGGISQQQNFVLLGGHTQQAFINMSQVALFSLPESSWSFLEMNQPSTNGEENLRRRDANNVVEPRSGHTAVLTPDGTKIILFGGWVGDVSTAADPQLAVLELGQGFGGTGDWAWAIPTATSNPFPTGQGLYGHGAAMLPGGVMMISGGYGISESRSSPSKRQSTSVQQANTQFHLLNTTSLSWISSYTNPASPNSPAYTGEAAPSSSGPLKTSSQKAGLGAGLALGFLAVAGILITWWFYSRRLRQKRALREKELRELALGGKFQSDPLVTGGMSDLGGGQCPERRSASWGSRQERRLGTAGGDDFAWAPVVDQSQPVPGESSRSGDGGTGAERTGLLVEVPSPTRGLRKSLHSRGPTGYGAASGNRPPSVGGGIHRIDEAEEENSRPGSLKKKDSVEGGPASTVVDRRSGYSDPFKDPPKTQDQAEVRSTSPSTEAKRQRDREVQGWVEDWSAAAAVMDRGGDGLSRNTSKAESNWRTLSNLSENYSHSGGMSKSGRGSPEKSDRTGSNLSERSTVSAASIQRSVLGLGTGGLSRNVSLRSASAGYALFAGAAAAMTAKVMGAGGSSTSDAPEGSRPGSSGVGRSPSKRSASLNLDGSSIRYGKVRDRSDTFTTAYTSHPNEGDALLGRGNSRTVRTVGDDPDHWATPPQSPVKERYVPAMRPREGSLGHAAGRAAMGILGSVKRVFTGTGSVGVQNRVAEFENRSAHNSPTKEDMPPEMTEVVGTPGRSASAATTFLKAQRGAKDWDEDVQVPAKPLLEGASRGMVVRRKPVPGQAIAVAENGRTTEDYGDGDWDVEAAVERRVVQVMFTVPKEKLRVVNADALSLLSKSDVDFEGGENEAAEGEENKRVSTVREETEAEDEEEGGGHVTGKGKEVVR